LAICAGLAVLAAVVFSKDIHVGGIRDRDGAVHAMDGALIYDWVRVGPAAWLNPVAFAVQQYTRYPCLGIVGVYPPGFALAEAAVFAVAGVSVVSARLTVVLFGLLAVAGCWLFVRRFASDVAALLAAASLIGMPMTVALARQVMLEMPTLAVLIWLAWAADRYVARPTWRRLLPVVALAVAGPLFKQNAIFIVPVLGVAALCLCRAGKLPWPHLLVGASAMVLPLCLYYGWAMAFQGAATHMARTFTNDTASMSAAFTWSSLTFYLRTLPQRAGPVILGLAGIGAALSLRRGGWRAWLLAGWFVAVYALQTLLVEKTDRYLFFAYFPMAVWVGMAAEALLRLVRPAPVRGPLVALAILALAAVGYSVPIKYRPDFTELVRNYADRMRGGVILVEANRDTCFVLAARSVLGRQAGVIVRGSKLLYSCASGVEWNFASHVSSRADVAALLDRFAFDLIFVERGNRAGLAEIEYLREELASTSRYELVGSHELRAVPDDRRAAVTIDVYRLRQPAARLVRELDIPVPLVGRTIRVRLDDL